MCRILLEEAKEGDLLAAGVSERCCRVHHSETQTVTLSDRRPSCGHSDPAVQVACRLSVQNLQCRFFVESDIPAGYTRKRLWVPPLVTQTVYHHSWVGPDFIAVS